LSRGKNITDVKQPYVLEVAEDFIIPGHCSDRKLHVNNNILTYSVEVCDFLI
jgi:hypothetical protein